MHFSAYSREVDSLILEWFWNDVTKVSPQASEAVILMTQKSNEHRSKYKRNHKAGFYSLLARWAFPKDVEIANQYSYWMEGPHSAGETLDR